MPTIISTTAQEKSTYVVTCAFTDEAGAGVVPTSIVWSLTDDDGTVLNSRDEVEYSSPAASIDIVLSGDDLQILAGETDESNVNRRIVVEAVYDSDAGSNLPLKAEASFVLENLTKIS